MLRHVFEMPREPRVTFTESASLFLGRYWGEEGEGGG